MICGRTFGFRLLSVTCLAAGLWLVGRVAFCTPSEQAHRAPEPSSARRTVVVVHTSRGDESFDAEIADTPADRARGLMERWSLPARAGMLFIFPREQHLTFWMKNTLIPLDMIFISHDRKIVGIVKKAKPLDTATRSVSGLSQFVLELAGGASDAYGIEPGQTVSFDVTIPVR